MKRIAAAVVFTLLSMGAYVPSDAERARWTMHDMMSWKTVFEAYYTDHKEYPHISTVEEARAIGEPTYIKAAPMHDAWGNPYRIEADGDSDSSEALAEALASIDMAAAGMWTRE